MAGRILIVDDQATGRLTLRMHLTETRHDVATAASGAEALEILAALPADPVILDEQLGDMAGLALCRRPARGRTLLPCDCRRAVLLAPGQPPVTVTIGIGVAIGSSRTAGTIHGFIEDADRALFRSKAKGRNTVDVFRPAA